MPTRDHPCTWKKRYPILNQISTVISKENVYPTITSFGKCLMHGKYTRSEIYLALECRYESKWMQ